ncbi:hypothetical protein FB446DRAFT_600757, partial [Lentinula raphanica]
VWLDAIMEHEFPTEYPAFKKAHHAGRWSETDPGPHLGRVIVWKLGSQDHIDDADAIPTIVYTLSGNFVGGFMDLLDVDTRLHYRPGALIVGFFGHLWHVVTPHEDRLCNPGEKYLNLGLTPGRVSVVNYFPTNSFNQLHDKSANWGRRTLYGRLEDAE